MKSSLLTFGFLAQGEQPSEELDWPEIESLSEPQGEQWRWLHFDRSSEEFLQWLNTAENAPEIVKNAMLQADTRPRVLNLADGFLLNLRGVNHTAGSSPEDMVSLRLWVTEHQVVSASTVCILAVQDLREAFVYGKVPKDTGAAIAFLAARLIERIDPVISSCQDELDRMEDLILNGNTSIGAAQLIGFRRSVLGIRRYIAPQRDAMSALINQQHPMLVDEDQQLHDALDLLIRHSEDLDLIRERAVLQHEQLVAERSDVTNDRLFVLSLISAVFLPLGIITGLFGVNIGGIPGTNSPYAFLLLTLGMLGIAVVVVWLFRRYKWI